MKFLFDFFPILLFFIAYKFSDIYIATLVAILASFGQVFITRIKTGQFEKMQLISLIVIAVLGGLTLIFRNELFIKWKPTAVYWTLSLILIFSNYFGKKPLIEHAASHAINLPAKVWYRLNWAWALFFAAMGLLNLYVVQNYDTDTWVNFKLFGTTGITFVFILLQGIYMFRHMKKST